MEVDTYVPSSSASKGKSVAVSTVLCLVITPYNAKPRTPRGMEIVERICRVSLQLVCRRAASPLEMDTVSPVSPVDAQGTLGTASFSPQSPVALQVEAVEGGCYGTDVPLSSSLGVVGGGYNTFASLYRWCGGGGGGCYIACAPFLCFGCC
jgi:hypothetical protein